MIEETTRTIVRIGTARTETETEITVAATTNGTVTGTTETIGTGAIDGSVGIAVTTAPAETLEGHAHAADVSRLARSGGLWFQGSEELLGVACLQNCSFETPFH